MRCAKSPMIVTPGVYVQLHRTRSVWSGPSRHNCGNLTRCTFTTGVTSAGSVKA